MADNTFTYWAFLCGSPLDNRTTPAAGRRCWGDWLDAALKAFAVPREFVGQPNGRGEIIPERIESVFRDESELPADAALSAETRQALEKSRCLVVICSPHSAQSRAVDEAVRYFKQLGRAGQILPFVIAGEPYASAGNKPGAVPADECFGPALRHSVLPDGTLDLNRRAGRQLFVDARHGVQPREILASDDRAAEADLQMAKIQLIALVLGVGFNGLWWREQQRHFFELAETRQQVNETLQQMAEIRRQLQAARQEAQAAQQQALEKQNLPPEVQAQIQSAQAQAHAARQQADEFQNRLQAGQNQVREMQAELAEARRRALAAETKVQEAEQQAREAQSQLAASQHQSRETQAAQSQWAESERQAQAAREKLQAAQNQVEALQERVRVAESELAAAREQVRAAQAQVGELQAQLREIQNRPVPAPGISNPNPNARRLVRVWAVLAALALLVAGTVAVRAWRQQQADQQALALATAEAAGNFSPPAGGTEPVRQVLEKIAGAAQAENRQHSLAELAAGISVAEIPEALAAAAVMVDDRPRSQFQKMLLLRLGAVNPLSALTNAAAIDSRIVNDAGAADTVGYFQLAIVDEWVKRDLPGALQWVSQLPAGDTRHQALARCIDELAKTDVAGALALAESLPDGVEQDAVLARLWPKASPFAAWEWINRVEPPVSIVELPTTPGARISGAGLDQ
jgi:MTH538 TIR-like domain (DUF1863)